MIKKTSFLLAFFLFFSVFISKAGAVPVFARKYETVCNTCHLAFPRLSAFGNAFRLNGYQMPQDDELKVKRPQVKLGSEVYKELWPKAIWPGELPIVPPFAVRFMYDFKTRSQDPDTTFDFPHEMELFMAGTLGKDIGFFTEAKVENKGTDVPQAVVVFSSLFDKYIPRQMLDLRVGKFDISAAPHIRDRMRLTSQHYLWGNHKINGWRQRGRQSGVEVRGIIKSYLRYSVGFVRGDSDASDANDTNGKKDAYFLLRYKMGGLGFDGYDPSLTSGKKTSRSSGFWTDNSLMVGIFGYKGTLGKPSAGNEDDFTRLGVDLFLNYEKLNINTGYILGRNDLGKLDSKNLFAEAEYIIFPWAIAILRYESLDLGSPCSSCTETDQEHFIPAMLFQVRPNVKVILEGSLYPVRDRRSGHFNFFNVRLDTAF